MYFAYDASMGPVLFKALCPGAEWMGVAKLEDHSLAVAANGAITVVPAGDSIVLGSLWLVPAEKMAVLEAHHGVGSGRSFRSTARVVTPGGPRAEVTMYASNPGPTGTEAESGHWIAVAEAAEENRLPARYVALLRSMGSPRGPRVPAPVENSH